MRFWKFNYTITNYVSDECDEEVSYELFFETAEAGMAWIANAMRGGQKIKEVSFSLRLEQGYLLLAL